MNQKAEKFDLLVADLNKGGNSWFTKEEMTDDLILLCTTAVGCS